MELHRKSGRVIEFFGLFYSKMHSGPFFTGEDGGIALNGHRARKQVIFPREFVMIYFSSAMLCNTQNKWEMKNVHLKVLFLSGDHTFSYYGRTRLNGLAQFSTILLPFFTKHHHGWVDKAKRRLITEIDSAIWISIKLNLVCHP